MPFPCYSRATHFLSGTSFRSVTTLKPRHPLDINASFFRFKLGFTAFLSCNKLVYWTVKNCEACNTAEEQEK